MKTKILYFSLAIVLSFAFLSECKQKNNKSNKKVVIACNLPLTGDIAVYGVSVRDGINFALSNLKNDNLLDSIDLMFDFQDNQGLAKTAVSIYQSQLIKKPNIYISGVSPQTMAIIQQTSSLGIPHIAWVYAANICETYKNTFRTWLSFNAEAEHYIQYAKKRKPKKVSIFYVNVDACRYEFDSLVVPALRSMGINEIEIEPYNIENSDFKNSAAKAKSFNPDLIFINGFKGHMIQLIKDFRSYNLINKGNTMCSYDLLDAAPELKNIQLEDLRYTVPYFVMFQDEPKVKEWKERFRKTYNREPLYTDAYAYDMTYAIYYATKQLYPPFTNENVTNSLLKVEFDGISGHFKFTDKGDLILTLTTAFYHDGKLIPETF